MNITGAGPENSGIYVQGSTYCKIKDNILHDDALGVFLDDSPYSVVSNNTATKNLLAGEGRAISIEGSDYSTVLNNRVSNNNHGIYVFVSNSNTVSGNTVNQSDNNGIVLENTENITVQNNNVNTTGDFGIYLVNSNGNFVRSNTVFNCSSDNGINLVASSGNEISSNTVSNPSINTNTHGIFMNTSNSNVIRNNTVSKNDYGVAMRYSTNNSVLSNTVSGNNRGIFVAYTSSSNTLSGNQVTSSIYSGITLSNAVSNTVFNNTARLNNGAGTTTGISVGGGSDNNLTGNTVSQNGRGIYISTSSSGNKVSGNTVSSNSGSGIYLENASINNNITNNNVSSNGGVGISLSNSSNTYVLNNVAPKNLRGIEVSTSNESVISNNTASNNAASGIRLSLSNNVTVSGNTAFNDTYGIELNSSRYNNISSNNITKSRTHGMFMCAQSRYNLVYNNYLNNTANVDIKNNLSTWNIENTSGQNIAGGNYLGGNFWGNPVLKNGHSQTQADANGDGFTDIPYVTDNLVDNLPLVTVIRMLPVANFSTNVSSGYVPLTVQFTDLSQSATGYSWNFGDGSNLSTQQNTTHTYTAAGNYTVILTASNSNGTATKTANITATIAPGPESILPDADFTASPTSGRKPLTVVFTDTSKNSTSRSWDVNGDGVADSTNASFAYTYTSARIYTATLTAFNANGTDTKTININVEGGSSGGGGGGGGGSPEPAKNVQVKELSQTFITNGKAVQFDLTKNATCVVYVNFDAKKTVGKTTTIVEQLKNKSTLVSNLTEGEVYRYFNVWVGNSGFASSENIDNPGICFKVEKSWLKDKKIDQNSITLNRYNNKKWEQLPATLLKEDSKYLYFTADVSGYSFFAITGESKNSPGEDVTDIKPEDKPGNIGNNTEDIGSEPEPESTEESKSAPGFGMICGIVGLSAAFLYRRK